GRKRPDVRPGLFRRGSSDSHSLNVVWNVPPPSLVVTPFSKKQPPPNEKPTVFTLWIATMKCSKTSGLSLPFFPFQSDHWFGSATIAVIDDGPWGSVSNVTSCTSGARFDHQNCV